MNIMNLFPKLSVFAHLFFQCFVMSANPSSAGITITEKPPTIDKLLEARMTTIPVEKANCSLPNVSCDDDNPGFLLIDSLLSHRTAFIILTSATLLIVVFFIIKFIRMRRKNSRKRKYDKGSSRGTTMEMRRLEEDDEEDDWTVFDATQGKPIQTR